MKNFIHKTNFKTTLNLIKKVSYIFILSLGINDSMAQDATFSQFYSSPVYLNPAMAGSAGGGRLVANCRNQWPQLNKGYKTYAVSYDQQINLISGGLGVTVMSDNAGGGILNTTSAGLMYAYRLNISRTLTVSAALQANIVQKKLNWDKLTFGDMIDPRYGVIYDSHEKRPGATKNFMDFCAGVFAYSNSIYGGFAVSHLTQPDEAFMVPGTSKLPIKYTVHAGAIIPIGEKITRFNGEEKETSFSPNLLVQKQGNANQFNIGTYFKKSAFVCGFWLRGNVNENYKISYDSFITLVGFQKGMFKFGYSYDISLSKLGGRSGGSHELSVGLQFPEFTAKKKRFKAVHCPSF